MRQGAYASASFLAILMRKPDLQSRSARWHKFQITCNTTPALQPRTFNRLDPMRTIRSVISSRTTMSAQALAAASAKIAIAII